ncbi:hypothetical protein T459_14581 [Capsicum annuum]|uniref:Uncharacterized protein n=1 Tax=Capsicum annuum TaxID=4072 RepID=A0A2G2ZHW2_CAPAN|nr:hypothetical protein T459_14581 [Capsicum annuum]
MPTDGDNILGDDQEILVTCLMANLKLNFGEIIAEEIKIRPRLTLNRGIRVEVNPSVAGPSSVPEFEVQTSEDAQAGSVPNDEPDPSVPIAPAIAASQPIDIRKMAKQARWCETQLHAFAEQFSSAIDKRIRAALEPFTTLPARVTDLDNHFNARAQELTGAKLYYQYIPEGKEFPILCKKLDAESKGWMKTVSSYMISVSKEEQVLLDWNGIAERHENDPSFCVDIASSKDGKFITVNSNSRTSSEARNLPIPRHRYFVLVRMYFKFFSLSYCRFMSSMQPICRLEFKDFVSMCLVYNIFLNIIMAFSMFSQILAMVVRNLHPGVESIIWLDALLRLDINMFEEKEVISDDGERIPITILFSHKAHKKGQSPRLLHGYGAYGEILDKSLCNDHLSLLDRGWVIAFADVRYFYKILFGDLSSVNDMVTSKELPKDPDESSVIKEKTEELGHTYFKGFLGHGNKWVVFLLNMNIDSVTVFLNKADGSYFLALLLNFDCHSETFLLDAHPCDPSFGALKW